MKDSIRHKLDNLKDRFGELEALLSDAEVISDQNRFRDLSKEYAELEELVQTFDRYVGAEGDLEQAREMQKDKPASSKRLIASLKSWKRKMRDFSALETQSRRPSYSHSRRVQETMVFRSLKRDSSVVRFMTMLV